MFEVPKVPAKRVDRVRPERPNRDFLIAPAARAHSVSTYANASADPPRPSRARTVRGVSRKCGGATTGRRVGQIRLTLFFYLSFADRSVYQMNAVAALEPTNIEIVVRLSSAIIARTEPTTTINKKNRTPMDAIRYEDHKKLIGRPAPHLGSKSGWYGDMPRGYAAPETPGQTHLSPIAAVIPPATLISPAFIAGSGMRSRLLFPSTGPRHKTGGNCAENPAHSKNREAAEHRHWCKTARAHYAPTR